MIIRIIRIVLTGIILCNNAASLVSLPSSREAYEYTKELLRESEADRFHKNRIPMFILPYPGITAFIKI